MVTTNMRFNLNQNVADKGLIPFPSASDGQLSHTNGGSTSILVTIEPGQF